MAGETLIELRDVGKRFRLEGSRRRSLRQWLVRAGDGPGLYEQDFTISHVSLTVRSPATLAILGDNGAGKSTLLRLMAGIYAPTTGRVRTTGRIASVLELGAGFHKELNGADNLAMYAAALGLSRSEFGERVDDMIEFADIGDVLAKPIKHYSTGMQARLALAVALSDIFDVILVDEALSVGDRRFRAKVEDRVRRYIANGGSIVLASHDLDFLGRTCDRAVWLQDGQIRADGPSEQVIEDYRRQKDRP